MVEDLAREIKSFSRHQLGFDLVGITTAEPLAGAGRLRRWIAAGRHDEMAYMADTAAIREDPSRFLPGARSVVCVAMSYHDELDSPEPPSARDRPIVARYARRKDYHQVIKQRLVRLGRFIGARAPEARWRVATDTAPLLEKELAERAGLGWIGKNTCLINRRLGSEVLLGELVSTLPLPADEPESDHCGRCSACLEACPTRALDAPHELDPWRCIAYLTIEHRTPLPTAMLPALGPHLFGCDICQTVCPWNRHAPPSCARPLAARPDLGNLELAGLDALDEQGWASLSAGTPLRRLDYARMRRTLAAVSANIGVAKENRDP